LALSVPHQAHAKPPVIDDVLFLSGDDLGNFGERRW